MRRGSGGPDDSCFLARYVLDPSPRLPPPRSRSCPLLKPERPHQCQSPSEPRVEGVAVVWAAAAVSRCRAPLILRQAHLLGQANLQVPARSSNAGTGAAPVVDRPPPPPPPPPPPAWPPAAVTSLADALFSTGRPCGRPEVGGSSQVDHRWSVRTCIICFTNPKSHVAVPCGHPSALAAIARTAQMQDFARSAASPVLMWVHVYG